MQLIDTHTHIYCEEFDQDRQECIDNAQKSGVIHMLLPAIDEETYQRQEALAASNPRLFSQMMGLHPTSVNDNYEQALHTVIGLVESNPQKYVGIGEIGLDLYWDSTYKDQQIDALKKQIRLAEKYDLPLALHVRNAYEELFEVLKDINRSTYTGVLHCYSGDKQQAGQAIEMGWMLGIGGTVTYKKSTLPEIVKCIPLERILLETDSPYLAPVPHRGQRNESGFIVHVAEFIANILEKSPEYIGQLTTENAINLFKLTFLQ